MARKGRHPRRQGRVAPRANRPTAAGRTWGDPEFGRPAEPELLTSVRRAVRSGRPVDLLLLASGLLTLVDPRCRDPFRRAEPADRPPLTLDGLVEPFRGVARPETSALLMVIAALAPGRDDEWRTSLAAEVARRGHRIPAWLDHLAAAQATKAVEMVHVLGDGDNVVVAPEVGEVVRRSDRWCETVEPYGPVLLGADMLTSARRRRLIAARDRVLGDA